MNVLIDVVEPVCVQAGGAALEAADLVALFPQELGEVEAVLAGTTGDWSCCHTGTVNVNLG